MVIVAQSVMVEVHLRLQIILARYSVLILHHSVCLRHGEPVVSVVHKLNSVSTKVFIAVQFRYPIIVHARLQRMTPADSVCKYCADVGIVSAIVDVHQLYAGREGIVLTVFLEMRFGVRTLHRHLAHTVLLQSLHHLHAYSVAVVGVMPMLVEQRNIPRVQKFAAFFLRRIRGIYINMVVWREAITHIQVVLQRTLQLLTRF